MIRKRQLNLRNFISGINHIRTAALDRVGIQQPDKPFAAVIGINNPGNGNDSMLNCQAAAGVDPKPERAFRRGFDCRRNADMAARFELQRLMNGSADIKTCGAGAAVAQVGRVFNIVRQFGKFDLSGNFLNHFLILNLFKYFLKNTVSPCPWQAEIKMV